jgi:O-acetyl-ADP-ribose deacetylase
MGRIEIVLGDITKQRVDAIVNAANKSLLKGGGVDGAIHRAAGSGLEAECMELGGCPTGEARITKSYNLEDQGVGWVIHAVGPRWLGGTNEEEILLESAYRKSLELAANYREIYLSQCESVLKKYLKSNVKMAINDMRREVMEDVKSYIQQNSIKTIAFPSISTGTYHFPVEKAACIAIKTISSYLDKNSSIDKVNIVCFDWQTYETYSRTLCKTIGF